MFYKSLNTYVRINLLTLHHCENKLFIIRDKFHKFQLIFPSETQFVTRPFPLQSKPFPADVDGAPKTRSTLTSPRCVCGSGNTSTVVTISGVPAVTAAFALTVRFLFENLSQQNSKSNTKSREFPANVELNAPKI